MYLQAPKISDEDEGILIHLEDCPGEVVIPFCGSCSEEETAAMILEAFPPDLIADVVVPLDGELSIEGAHTLVAELRDAGVKVIPTLLGVEPSWGLEGRRHLILVP